MDWIAQSAQTRPHRTRTRWNPGKEEDAEAVLYELSHETDLYFYFCYKIWAEIILKLYRCRAYLDYVVLRECLSNMFSIRLFDSYLP